MSDRLSLVDGRRRPGAYSCWRHFSLIPGRPGSIQGLRLPSFLISPRDRTEPSTEGRINDLVQLLEHRSLSVRAWQCTIIKFSVDWHYYQVSNGQRLCRAIEGEDHHQSPPFTYSRFGRQRRSARDSSVQISMNSRLAQSL